MECASVAAYRDYVKGRLKASVSSQEKYENEKIHLFHLIKRCVKLGESNSAIVVGSRSCEKTQFVNCVLSELQEERDFQNSAVVVRLHGFIHTDDAVTLRAIAQQMGFDGKSQDCVSGSFAENFSLLFDCLRTGDRKYSKSTIVILDEFDLFCSRSRQALLYNLFDIAQSASAPLCVIGLTCRIDVTELLEKRVKSRFSNRQIYIFPDSSKSGLEDFLNCSIDMLSLPLNVQKSFEKDKFIFWLNKNMTSLDKDPIFHDVVECFFQFDVSKKCLHLFLNFIISFLDQHFKFVESKELSGIYLLLQDARLNMLESLSVLEVCLIIGMNHHIRTYDVEAFNFEMIYNEYLKFITKNFLDFTIDRAVVVKAFENIVNLELIIPIKTNKNEIFKECQMFRLGISPQQVDAGIRSYKNLPTEVKQWAINSVPY